MKKFRVQGRLEYTEQCDCEFCEGHDERRYINKIVDAVDCESAIEEILTSYIKVPDNKKARWLGEPKAIEIENDVLMTLIGAPQLFT